MRKPKLLTALGLGMLMACAEATGPPAEGAASAPPTMHALRWRGDVAPSFRAERRDAGGRVLPAPLSPLNAVSGNGGTGYSVSFWAVRGEARTLRIDVMGASVQGQFLEIAVPAAALAYRPNGTPFVAGDSIFITVQVDASQLVVDFEPSGLVFNEGDPAVLYVWYTAADEDLNADGEVNEADLAIQEDLLGISYRGHVGGSWEQVSSDHAIASKRFALPLAHFSGYAVSY